MVFQQGFKTFFSIWHLGDKLSASCASVALGMSCSLLIALGAIPRSEGNAEVPFLHGFHIWTGSRSIGEGHLTLILELYWTYSSTPGSTTGQPICSKVAKNEL